jgi:hypothetical protein
VLTVEERIAELWRRGELWWKLYPDQREVYWAIRDFLSDPATRFEDFWVDISRQYGKTFIGLLISTEDAIRNAGWSIGYTAATRAALWQFVQPNMETLLSDCPTDLRPDWSGLTSDYVFPNGSFIHLAGVNNGHENDARGPRRHLMMNEEAGFVDRFEYLHDSVELPMLTTTGGRILNITTPAETAAHESHAFRERCRVAGRYIKRTIDDNRHLSDGAKAKIIQQAGGRDSTNARRELFCEWVTDASRAIVPEYDEKADAEIAAEEPPPPTFEQPIVSMDPAFEDGHAILFGYYDFRRAKLVIQAEALLHRQTTDKVAEVIRATEAKLWGEGLRTPVRWSDTDLRLIEDLSVLHRLPFQPTAKDDKEAQINALRMRVKSRGLHISPSCVALRRQLRLGIWNKQRSQFERTKEDGHFDAVDALVYMLRNAPVYENPYPAVPPGVTDATHHIRIRDREKSEAARAMEELFARRS